MSVRRPAVAGSFYPSDPDELRSAIRCAFTDAVTHAAPAAPPKALIVPHAGYIYSGAIAASAFARIVDAPDRIRRVVLLGPSHRAYVRGIAAPSVDAFETPLGDVPVDAELREVAIRGGAIVDDEPHRLEHSLEVELPFLQTVLDEFTVLPLSVGDAATNDVATVLEAVWGGPETLIVVSTDLSHYRPYDEATRVDGRTAEAIVATDPDAIGDHDACGSRPLRGLLHEATRRRLSIAQLDLRNSGDTAGDRHRVVGYGAFAVG